MPEQKKTIIPKSAGCGQVTALVEEMATYQAATGPWFLEGWPLPNPDPILRATGQALPVYRALRRPRRRAGAPPGLRQGAGNADRRGQGQNEDGHVVETALAGLDMPAVVGGLWEAALFGYAVAEVLWERRGGFILPASVVAKPQEWFTFDSAGRLLFMAAGSAHGVPVPPKKFLLARQDATVTNPYGMADLARCFWPYTFKKGGLKFWLQFVEKEVRLPETRGQVQPEHPGKGTG